MTIAYPIWPAAPVTATFNGGKRSGDLVAMPRCATRIADFAAARNMVPWIARTAVFVATTMVDRGWIRCSPKVERFSTTLNISENYSKIEPI